MTCEQARSIPRAEETPASPIPAHWDFGRKKPGDIVCTTWGLPLLISDRVVTVLQDARLTGWGTYPVELFGHDGTPIPGYHGFCIHGRCGPIDNSKSVQVMVEYPGGLFPEWQGMYFDPATWDGSDFFMETVRSGWMFAVEDVKRVVTKAKIKDLHFTSLAEILRMRLP